MPHIHQKAFLNPEETILFQIVLNITKRPIEAVGLYTAVAKHIGHSRMLLRFEIQDVLNRQMDRFPIDLDRIGFTQRLQMLQA